MFGSIADNPYDPSSPEGRAWDASVAQTQASLSLARQASSGVDPKWYLFGAAAIVGIYLLVYKR